MILFITKYLQSPTPEVSQLALIIIINMSAQKLIVKRASRVACLPYNAERVVQWVFLTP